MRRIILLGAALAATAAVAVAGAALLALSAEPLVGP